MVKVVRPDARHARVTSSWIGYLRRGGGGSFALRRDDWSFQMPEAPRETIEIQGLASAVWEDEVSAVGPPRRRRGPGTQSPELDRRPRPPGAGLRRTGAAPSCGRTAAGALPRWGSAGAPRAERFRAGALSVSCGERGERGHRGPHHSRPPSRLPQAARLCSSHPRQSLPWVSGHLMVGPARGVRTPGSPYPPPR